MECGNCSKSTDKTKLPPGWHREHDGSSVCGDCWSSKYILRSISMPVATPVDGDWDTLRSVLKTCWSASTSVANWAVNELAKADTVRLPSDTKIGKAPSPYLYPGARAVAPEMDPTSVTSLLRSVERKYRAKRYDVIWLRNSSLPAFRYPMPYPVHNASWSVSIAEGNPVVSVRLGGERRQLQLVSGSEWRRQLSQVRCLVNKTAHQGELSILEKKVHGKSRLFVKMVAWLPRKAVTEKSGALIVKTGPGRFWDVSGGSSPWLLNADKIRERQIAHANYLQRSSEDLKFEKRWPAWKRKQLLEDQRVRCEKHNRRLDAFLHDASAMLANYAERQNAIQVIYDDADTSWCSFPWFRLRELVQTKLDERGIRMTQVARGPEEKKAPKSLAKAKQNKTEEVT